MCYHCRFTLMVIYYGVSFNAAAFGSVFLNTFLLGLIDVPAVIICRFCVFNVGRRWSNVGSFLACGVTMLACVPVLLIRPGVMSFNQY